MASGWDDALTNRIWWCIEHFQHCVLFKTFPSSGWLLHFIFPGLTLMSHPRSCSCQIKLCLIRRNVIKLQNFFGHLTPLSLSCLYQDYWHRFVLSLLSQKTPKMYVTEDFLEHIFNTSSAHTQKLWFGHGNLCAGTNELLICEIPEF